jgi:hypothetical protein
MTGSARGSAFARALPKYASENNGLTHGVAVGSAFPNELADGRTYRYRDVPPVREDVGKCATLRYCATRSTLGELAARVLRLCPDHRDPERFWHEKSEVAAELRRLAREVVP